MDKITLHSKNFYKHRHNIYVGLSKILHTLYIPSGDLKRIFYNDIVDGILKYMYNANYFNLKYQMDNKIKFTINCKQLIKDVKTGNHLELNFYKYEEGIKTKIFELVKSLIRNKNKKESDNNPDKLKNEIDENGDSSLTSNENIIGRLIYSNLGDNKDKLPSDVISNIIKKSSEDYKSYFALKEKGIKPNRPKFLGKDEKFNLIYYNNHAMKIIDNKIRLFTGEYISNNYKQIIKNNNLIKCTNNKYNASYINEDNIKKGIKIPFSRYTEEKLKQYMIDGGFTYIKIPEKMIQSDELPEYPQMDKIYYKKINMVDIVPENCKYKICIVYEPTYMKKIIEGKIDPITDGISIDFGMKNLMAIYDPTGDQKIVDGKEIVALNEYYNHDISELQSMLRIIDRYTSKRFYRLHERRKNKIDRYMNLIVKWLFETYSNKKIIILGKNVNWKEKINLGRNTNRKFCQIPYSKLIKKIKDKGHRMGIKVVITEESYTSKCDALALEEVCKHESGKYSGKRIKRGLFRSKNGRIINADINGAINIMRKYCKVKGYEFNEAKGIKIFNPKRVYVVNERNKKRK